MTVNVVRFQDSRWGVLREGRIVRIPGEYPTTGDLLAHASPQKLAELHGPSMDARELAILAPITPNQQFICQGANYRQHMIESGVDPDAKTFNMIFTKAPGCIVPASSDVILPRRVRFLDYEIELGLVLRRDIRGPVEVTDANLHEFVGAAVIVNDYSARDIQIPEIQFYKGKSFRTFGPVGPHLALLDASNIHLLRRLRLTLTVNGAVRQDDTTENLVYGPAETLTELSRVQDLDAGDLLSTGTPAGCALAIPSPAKQRIAQLLPEGTRWSLFSKIQSKRPYLEPGDVVEARIRSADGTMDLGVQRNRIVAEA
jgi:2-keto-4-pentenoate hydratase/2-oxohepta-3-ene-1,7-dioic acid hydratase in catechol pathway